MSGAGQVTPIRRNAATSGLGGKLKPLDCRTNLSRLAEKGQVMPETSGKNEETSKECTQHVITLFT